MVMSSHSGVVISTSDEFVERAEAFRSELLAHCYRMLGSIHDAEDLVQETYLRAWRSYAGFEGRSSLRTWLYQIATNACLTALKNRVRRPLPSGLGAPSGHSEVPVLDKSGITWLEPIPDALVTPDSEDPAVIAAFRDSVRLALIASLQYLPPRQRAVLILRDVLDWSAAEVAQMLGTTTAAVKSTLQRARARLKEIDSSHIVVTESGSPEFRSQLYDYIRAFETADAAILEKLLRKDACLEMTPVLTWLAGKSTCVPYLAKHVLGRPGDWRMVPTAANGQAALAAYWRGSDGVHRAYGIVLLTTTSSGIARIVGFGDPTLFAAFDLPATCTAAALCRAQ